MIIDHNNFIKELQKKNPKALDFTVDTYINLVFKIAGNILNTSFHNQYAEECVNDVFWSVWNNIESFDYEKGNFKYWITAIAKYKAIDYKRKLSKQSTYERMDDYNFDDYNFQNDISTEKIIISKENKEELLKIIDEMNKVDKQIFIRRYFLYENIENIAESYGLNRNVIDKRLSRGRKFLKEKLIILRGEISNG